MARTAYESAALSRIIPGATTSLLTRIKAKTLVLPGPNGCHRWGGALSRKRDGTLRPVIQVGRRGSMILHVTRVLLALQDRVPLPERQRLHAAHTCGYPWCVRRSHLRWATPSENETDKHEYDASVEYQQYPEDEVPF